MILVNSITGCILGTAVGDSLGLVSEGVSPARIKKLYGEINKHNFIFGKGMISDDTEHTCIVAQSLILSKGDEIIFASTLARHLKFWLLTFPAGIGFATLRALIKLIIGFPPDKSGIFSAGNGPAMRSAIIGVCYGYNIEKFKKLIHISTRITHADTEAEIGALTVAFAAHISSTHNKISPDEFYLKLQNILSDLPASEFLIIIKKVIASVNNKESTKDFAVSLGLTKGISGYSYHTVPMVIHCWLKNQNNFATAVKEIISCGGDTDTTAAIVGGIIGANTGKEGIPKEWMKNIFEWNYSINWLENLSACLADSLNKNSSMNFKSPNYLKILVRNIFFMLIVILQGLRRLLPPY